MSEVDYTRPLLLGYVLKHLLMADSELADIKVQLEQFGAVEGFSMGTIYVEKPGRRRRPSKLSSRQSTATR